MLTADPLVPGPAALAEAKAYLRIEGTSEDPLIERLIASSAALCEQFAGQVLLARGFAETIAATTAWTRLRRTPVAAITSVDAIFDDGAAALLPAGAFAVDIDANGDGWVRLASVQAARTLRVRYSAGLAAEWSGLPEPLRQGTVRLAAHLYTHRSAEDAGPPAVVSALWRPYCRMRLG